jgi:hypothetical protein
MYNLYSSNTETALKQILDRLKYKEILLTKEDQQLFNTLFIQNKSTKMIIDEISNSELKEGITKKVIETKQTKEIKEIEGVETKINYMDILKHIIPLICLLTIHEKETSFIEMFKIIEDNEQIYNILLEQIKSWWGKDINDTIIKNFINIYIKYVKNDKSTNQLIRVVKEVFIKNITNNKELSKLIDKYLIPQELEKKTNAEVSTPFKLRQEMLDKMPIEFWKQKNKVFEPCCGKGGFLIDIIDRFMDNLTIIEDKKLRYKTIVEDCLYFSDINPTNIFICKLLIDPFNEYNLNYNLGDTLKINIKEKWKIEGFNGIIGNPPYNDDSDNKGAGHKIWDKFMEISIKKWLNKQGYLLYIHPPLWRQPYNKLLEIVKNNNLIYLEIHNEKDGLNVFKCATRYDWYLLSKDIYNGLTIIKDEFNKMNEIDINNWLFIPNGYFDEIYNLINSDEKHNIISDRSNYGADKKWIVKVKNNNYIYPVIYSIYKDNSIQLRYSNINTNGHFNIPKIIFTPNLGLNYIIDKDGIYGLTQWVIGICDERNNLYNISKIFNNNIFKNILKSIKFGMYYNSNVIKLFKKNFWKDFI